MRGNGDSQGLLADEYTEQELADREEVIAWLARQDWCSGAVRMMGISWGGFNALQLAARRPAALKALVTLCSTVDRYADDIHYKGGCLLNENLGWGATMWAYSSRAPDPALVGEDWRAMWLERLENEPFLPAVRLRHQARHAYWRHGSVCEDFAAIEAATLAVDGWGDAYRNAVPQLVENLNAPVKGILGPWVHKYPHFAVPEPRIGFLQEAMRWWDRWFKGIDTGVETDPDYRAYLMDGLRPAHWYAKRPGPEMPGDQRPDDALSACFGTGSLAEEIDILDASRLNHVHSDGAATRITYGVLNLSHRNGHAAPEPLRPGEGFEVTIPLDHIAYRVSAGHRLRVAISSAYWPLIWPSPESAELHLTEGQFELPHREAATAAKEWEFPAPDAEAPGG